MNAEYYRGLVKETVKQQKKYVEQMTPEEKVYLSNEIKKLNLNKTYIGKHLQNKIGVDYNLQTMLSTLKKDSLTDLIIEYNETPVITDFEDYMDKRVLIRDNDAILVNFKDINGKNFKEYANMCFVISLEKNKIITCYWNIVNDSHVNINWTRYNGALNIIKN